MAQGPDAIVVGSGIAGLSAAYELAKGGAKDSVIDMASVFGGHAVMATGDLCLVATPFQEAQGIKDSPDLAYQDFMKWGASLGVTFETLVLPAGNSVKRTHRTKGRGISLVSPAATLIGSRKRRTLPAGPSTPRPRANPERCK